MQCSIGDVARLLECSFQFSNAQLELLSLGVDASKLASRRVGHLAPAITRIKATRICSACAAVTLTAASLPDGSTT